MLFFSDAIVYLCSRRLCEVKIYQTSKTLFRKMQRVFRMFETDRVINGKTKLK